jgi:hypothetical protein
MTAQKLGNINGILDQFLSVKRQDAEVGKPTLAAGNTSKEKPRANSLPSPEKPVQVRRGRPPGKTSENIPPKEKVTLWINRDLIAQYRDWSWEVRCQLSPLIEEAMQEFRKKK